VAAVDGQPRTYRVARFRRAELTDERFDRPSRFELAAFWTETTAAYVRATERVEIVMRIDPRALGVLADLVGATAVRAAETITPPAADPSGWQHLRLRVEWPREAAARLLALGASAEVLEPSELRAEIAGLARQALERYQAPPL
jgi:predicted DNA-binding transcriptional regulator YafY